MLAHRKLRCFSITTIPLSLLLLLQLTAWSCEGLINASVIANTEVYQSNDLLTWLEKSNFARQIFESNLCNKSTEAAVAVDACFSEVNKLLQAANSKQIWALKFLDAWGKYPSGVLYGHFVEFGNYDQCLTITAMESKYCLSSIPFDNVVRDDATDVGFLKLRIGTCIPAACSAAQLDTMLKHFLSGLLGAETLNATLVRESNCSMRRSQPFTALDWFAVGVLCFLAALLLISTICDYYSEQREQTLHLLLAAFSLRINLRQLFHISHAKQAAHIIPCLHGIRCLSIIWIIFGHGYMLLLLSPNINSVEIIDWAQTPFSMFLQSGTISVDTFFFLSGLLLVMITLRQMDKTKGKLNVPLMYLHRYLRLTPVLALAVLIFVTLYRHSGNGPIWQGFTSSYNLCDQTWWATLLYVQNYAAPGKMCLGHSWYLAVDMQLYIISPILLIALWRWRRKAAAAIVVLAVLLLGCLFSIVMFNHLQVFSRTGNLGADSVEMRKIYYTTHARAVPWLIGLLFGFYLYSRAGKRVTISKFIVCLAWLLSLAAFFGVLFATYPQTQPGSTPITPLAGAFYLTLSRTFWPLALCWVVFACMNGYGGPANSLLSWSFWQPISKLSYGLYIWHLMVETVNAGRTKVNTHFSDYDAILFFWASFGQTLLVSAVMYLAIEAPMVGVEKIIFAPKKKPSSAESAKNMVGCSVSAVTESRQNLVI